MKVSITFVLILFMHIVFIPSLYAQDYEWEIDKIERREQKKKKELDSLMVHLKNRWELSISNGRWFFQGNVRSTEEEYFFLPDNMGIWQFSVGWHFAEKWFTGITAGIQQKKNVPAQPNIFDVISGEEITVEGSGGGFVPLYLELKYQLTDKRLRPYVSFAGGAVMAQSQYTLVEGNIFDGITKTDYSLEDRARIIGIGSGVDYRWGKNTGLSINLSYHMSENFEEPIGGYISYKGFHFEFKFLIIL